MSPFLQRSLVTLRAFFCALLLMPICLCRSADEPSPPITLYSYHLRPPLVIDLVKKQGIYFELTRYLQARLKVAVELEIVPRKRLLQQLEQTQFDGFIIGVSPLWFDDGAETKYLWSAAFMSDRNEIVSLLNTPLEFHDVNDLVGRKLGLNLGHVYVGIDELVARGLIRREDTEDEIQNLEKLLRRRVDAVIVSRSTVDYFKKQRSDGGKLYISSRPQLVYERRILATKQQQQNFDRIAPVLAAMANDPEWQARLARFR